MRPFEETPYWLMGFNTSQRYNQFDLQANALALLLRLGTAQKRAATVEFIKDLLGTLMLPSFYPVVGVDADAMRELQQNYAFRFRNAPHEFHNGGLWSVWNGLLSLSMGTMDDSLSQRLLARITSACAQRGWDFNECHHGETGEPIGISRCAWSAAGLLLAANPSFQSQLLL
jgi:hypothetical protein